MSGVTATLTTLGLDDAISALSHLANFEMAQLADDAGAILESSTRGRFDTKEGPDGTAWPEWSEAYAATRKGQHSLLVGGGDLRDSIASYSTGTEVVVGTNLVYGAHQHFGSDDDAGIPPRPFLGVSNEDGFDLREALQGRLAELVR